MEDIGDKAVDFLDSIEDYIPDAVIDKLSDVADVVDEKWEQLTEKLEDLFDGE